MTMHRAGLLLVVPALLFVAGGCGGGPRMAEVEGVVKLNGKALGKIQVEFWPETDGPRSMGVTDADGKFTLTTDDGKRIGASVGWHKVVLKDIGVQGDVFLGRAGEDVDFTKGKKPKITSYGDPLKTDVRKEVTAGKCTLDIDLTRP